MDHSRLQRKPAGKKVRDILRKLEVLAERGIDGEKIVAQHKIQRLKERYDFGEPAPTDTPDLFKGVFKRGRNAQWICSFGPNEFDIANFVKWAIESATGVTCVFRNGDLAAQLTIASARQLAPIASQITHSFRTLLAQFSAVKGVSPADQTSFVRGLYDGMMNDPRDAGKPLPTPAGTGKKVKGNKTQKPASGLHIHPYTVAFGLGKQIRFSVPVQQIAEELKAAIQKELKNAEPS